MKWLPPGVPVGWGAPVYGKLDTDLVAAMMSINAVKGVEIGNGFAAAALSGEENADEMTKKGFSSNHAGGVIGRHFDRPRCRCALCRQTDFVDFDTAPNRRC